VNCAMLPEAQIEATQAALWYDAQRVGLGAEFLDELQLAVERIQTAPLEQGRLELYLGEQDIRRCLLRRFPYLVIYRVASDELVIVAVAHARRRPNFWVERIDD